MNTKSAQTCYLTTIKKSGTTKPNHPFLLPDVFIVSNGPHTGLQQPVHEPARSPRPPWRHESSQHGVSHEQPEHEWSSYGYEPGSDPGHGAFCSSRTKDASAGIPRWTATGDAHAGDEEALSWRGE